MKNIEIMLNMLKSIIILQWIKNNNIEYRIEAIGRTTEWHEGH